MKKLLLALFSVVCLAACTQKQPVVSATDWANTVVYEMNVRQYTPEGTFAAAQRELPRLKELGIDVVWLMPIYPIGIEGRKGTLGSYYAIKDYTDINPEFGTLADFDSFLAEAHRLGLKVIIAWVANHTSPDARWVTESPASWYERDTQGGLTYTADWSDTANLNYADEGMVKGMQEAMHFCYSVVSTASAAIWLARYPLPSGKRPSRASRPSTPTPSCSPRAKSLSCRVSAASTPPTLGSCTT